MFPEELPGLSLKQEVEFGTDLVPKPSLVLRTHNIMIPENFRELQFQDLSDKEYIQPSVSLWGLLCSL